MTSTSLSLVLFPVIPANDRAKRGSELLFLSNSFLLLNGVSLLNDRDYFPDYYCYKKLLVFF